MPPRVGHGPFGLGWPWPIWKQLFYDSRPDLLTSKTRPPEWQKLKSQWRFFHALFYFVGPPSHVLWNIKYPWLLTMAVAGWLSWWQVYLHAIGHDSPLAWDNNGVLMDTFKMTSFAMSLLLAFRVNRTYDRWREARSSLAGVGNGATALFIQGATWIDNAQVVEDLRRFCIVWPYSIMQVVTSATALDPAAAALLHADELKIYNGSRKGRQVVVTAIQKLIVEANLPHEIAQVMVQIQQTTWKSAGDALRIKFQAMPTSISMMCTAFVQIWCLLLPFGLISNTGEFEWIPLLAVVTTALLLLGCDEVANQLEDPFHFIPCYDIVVTYYRDINRVQEELQGIRKAHEAARCARARKPQRFVGDSDLPSESDTGGAGSASGSAGSDSNGSSELRKARQELGDSAHSLPCVADSPSSRHTRQSGSGRDAPAVQVELGNTFKDPPESHMVVADLMV